MENLHHLHQWNCSGDKYSQNEKTNGHLEKSMNLIQKYRKPLSSEETSTAATDKTWRWSVSSYALHPNGKKVSVSPHTGCTPLQSTFLVDKKMPSMSSLLIDYLFFFFFLLYAKLLLGTATQLSFAFGATLIVCQRRAKRELANCEYNQGILEMIDVCFDSKVFLKVAQQNKGACVKPFHSILDILAFHGICLIS